MKSQKSNAAKATKASKSAPAGRSSKIASTPRPKSRKTPTPRTAKIAPAAKASVSSKTPLPPLLRKVVQALDAKKAERLQILNVSRLSSITDFLVVGTATSDPHLRALRVELEKVIDADQTKILGIDTSQGSGWTVVDAFDVMVHLFTPENRDKYRLELLWKDAETVDVKALL